MASKKTLNASNLEALGAERLAELLIEISDGNAATKRRLRLELADAESPNELAKRLFAANHADEAWRTIEAAEHRDTRWLNFDWVDARIHVLGALGRKDDTQAARWSCFERALSARHLRAYLQQLPDFDDVEAEERAIVFAERHGSLLQAISFLVSWPAVSRTALVVITILGCIMDYPPARDDRA